MQTKKLLDSARQVEKLSRHLREIDYWLSHTQGRESRSLSREIARLVIKREERKLQIEARDHVNSFGLKLDREIGSEAQLELLADIEAAVAKYGEKVRAALAVALNQQT